MQFPNYPIAAPYNKFSKNHVEILRCNSSYPQLWNFAKWQLIFIFLETLSLHMQACVALLFRAAFKWRLQENRFFLVFGLIIHFMATTTKAKRCIFISRTPKCPGYRSILNKSRWYRLFSALPRSQFGPIWILWSHGWWKLWGGTSKYCRMKQIYKLNTFHNW